MLTPHPLVTENYITTICEIPFPSQGYETRNNREENGIRTRKFSSSLHCAVSKPLSIRVLLPLISMCKTGGWGTFLNTGAWGPFLNTPCNIYHSSLSHVSRIRPPQNLLPSKYAVDKLSTSIHLQSWEIPLFSTYCIFLHSISLQRTSVCQTLINKGLFS